MHPYKGAAVQRCDDDVNICHVIITIYRQNYTFKRRCLLVEAKHSATQFLRARFGSCILLYACNNAGLKTPEVDCVNEK